MTDPVLIGRAIDALTEAQHYARIERDTPGARCVVVPAKDDAPEVVRTAREIVAYNVGIAVRMLRGGR